MISQLDEYLSLDCSLDYWSDEAVLIVSEILGKFDDKSWILLKSLINDKNSMWLERLADSLSSVPNEYSTSILCELLNDKNKDVVITALDSLNEILTDNGYQISDSQVKHIVKRLDLIINPSKIESIMLTSLKHKLASKF